MAIIPSDEKVFMVDKRTNTVYGGSAALQAMQQWYTMQDVVDSVEVGSTPTLNIIANGTIPPTIISYSTSAVIPSTPINGEIFIPITTVPDININGQNLTTTATLVEFPNATRVINVQFYNNNSVESLAFPELVTCTNSIQLTQNPNLTTLNFPKLTSITNSLSFGDTPLLTNINFSLLQRVVTIMVSGNVGITGLYQSYFPSLTTAGFGLQGNPFIFELDMDSVTTLTSLQGSFTKVKLPNTISITDSYIVVAYNLNLVEFNIGVAGTVKFLTNQPFMSFNNTSINEVSINNLLTMLASLDGTNGTTVCSSGYLDISGGASASPSGAGITAKNTLLSRGWTVLTN